MGYAAKYLSAAIADSQEAFLVALRDVADAKKMARVAEEANVSRESLYRTLSKEGNPRFSTLDSVLSALGMVLSVQLKQPVPAPSVPPIGGQERTITVALEAGGNTKITSTASSAFRNVATAGAILLLTNDIAVTTTPGEQSESTHAGFPPGFIAYATGADQPGINALGD
jgi:probable addiction module antidote protein